MSPDMNDNDGDGDGAGYARLDATLRRFVGEELDGQLGRARAAFEAHVAQSARSTREMHGRRRHVSRSRVWAIGLAGAGAAMAASLAAVWAVPLLGRKASSQTATTSSFVIPQHNPSSRSESPRAADNAGASAASDSDWQPVQQVTSTATLYQGMVLVGGESPARVLRSVSTERTEWFDPERKIRMETTVPREQVMLIGVDTY